MKLDSHKSPHEYRGVMLTIFNENAPLKDIRGAAMIQLIVMNEVPLGLVR
jgi:hypothetical protein